MHRRVLAVLVLTLSVATSFGCGDQRHSYTPICDEDHWDYGHVAPDGTYDPCHTSDVCPHPDFHHIGPNGYVDPCHLQDADGGTDAGTSVQEPCPSEMCHERLAHWDGPWLLWSGPPDQVPECPVLGAAGIAYEGYNDLAPAECARCGCTASSGTCELSPVLTAHDVQCKALGEPHEDISFNAEPGWTGACDASHPIPKSADVVSLSVSAIKIHEDGCKVIAMPIPRDRGALPAKWNTLARACAGSNWTPCEQSNAVCIQTIPEPFELCLSHEGDVECPAWGAWHVKRLFFGGIDDQRQCSECSCDSPRGSSCAASLSVYETTCGGALVMKDPISSVDESCFDVLPPGLPLGSKAATSPVYTPGTCDAVPGAPSGGTAEKTDPVTFCCEL